MTNRYAAIAGRCLFLAFVLWNIQVLNVAQTAPQSGEQQHVQSVNFVNMRVKTALKSLIVSSTKFDLVFDDSVKDSKITIEMKDVKLRQAIEAILEKQELQVRMKDDHTLFIFADTPENRDKYAEMEPWPVKP